MKEPWTITSGASPLIATAIHAGHDVRPDALEWMVIDEETRLREEDPYTDRLAQICDSRIVAHRSRFEVDLNRPRDRAIYRTPEESWGIPVWKDGVPDSVFEESLTQYNAFNRDVFDFIDERIEAVPRIVIFDLHSYNYRRKGPDGPPADPAQNPEINLGTGTMDRDRNAPIVDAFLASVGDSTVGERPIDIRENINFRGGDFARRLHQRYPEQVCVLSIEFKKTFMDEWSGELRTDIHAQLYSALEGARDAVLKVLR